MGPESRVALYRSAGFPGVHVFDHSSMVMPPGSNTIEGNGKVGLCKGCRVCLTGLTSSAGELLNGVEGVVDIFVASKQRWAVIIPDRKGGTGHEKKTFKAENLQVVGSTREQVVVDETSSIKR